MALNFKQIGLGLLIGIAIIGIKTGIKYYNSSTAEAILDSIEKGMPKSLQDGTVRLPSALSEDGKGVIMYFQLPTEIFSDLKQEEKASLEDSFSSLAGYTFCKSIAKGNQLGRFFTSSNSNYINLVVGDKQVKEGVKIKVNREFCNTYNIKKTVKEKRGEKDFGELAVKQKKQGYFDDEFLQVFVKKEKAFLPVTLAEDFIEMYNVSAKDRELTYYIRPLPSADYDDYINEFDPKPVKEFFRGNYCTTPNLKEILSNVKAVNFKFDELPDVKIQITKDDCK